MGGSVHGLMDRRVSVWAGQCLGGWMGESVCGRVSAWVDGWESQCVGGSVHGLMDRRVSVWAGQCVG